MSLLEIEHKPAIEYAAHDGAPLSGDFYAPKRRDKTNKLPLLIALHGGAWRLGDRGGYRHWGRYLAERGYALFSIDYRLASDAKKMFPEAVHDVRVAVQFVRDRAEEWGIDGERIGLIGDSAGAHLAAMAALADDVALSNEDSKPKAVRTVKGVKAVIGVYGVYDLAAQWNSDQLNRPNDQITERFLGTSLAENRRLFFEASPVSHATLDRNKTAFLLVWGTADDIVDGASQSESFLRALKQANFFVRTVVLQGAPHFWMWDPIDEPNSWTAFLAPRLMRFLEVNL